MDALNVPAAAARQPAARQPRTRALGRRRAARHFVLVNLPAFKAYLIRDRKNVWETRTQIGREARQTPTFRADMKYVVLNPDWTVPPTILAQDVLAGMKKGQNTIAQEAATILDAQGRAVDPSTIDWQAATPAQLPLHAAPAARRRQRARPGQVHLPERALDLPARHAEPGALLRRPADVQLGLHPGRARAGARPGPAGGPADAARRLERGSDHRDDRRRRDADRVLRRTAAGPHRLLDGLDRRRRRPSLRPRRLRPGPALIAGAGRRSLILVPDGPAYLYNFCLDQEEEGPHAVGACQQSACGADAVVRRVAVAFLSYRLRPADRRRSAAKSSTRTAACCRASPSKRVRMCCPRRA